MLFEEEIKKIENYLPYEKDIFKKIQQLDSLRYFYKQNEKEKEKVIYDIEKDELLFCNSIRIGIEITEIIPKNIKNISIDNRGKAIEIMKNNYYYLAGYLFSYYLIAIEFGIEPEKQFLAPRTSVLGPISKKLEKFYYKPKGVMTISMPQGMRKNRDWEKIYVILRR